MNAIRTFIDRPIFTSMLVLALVVFGLYAFPRIGVDQFPEVDFPVVTVVTVLPGADPETIERTVSKPLEEALNTLSGLDTLRSMNVDSVSQLAIRFTLDKDADVAAQEVRDRVQATLMRLPPEIKTPIVEKFDLGAAPIGILALAGALPIQELTALAEDRVKPALQRLDGVGAIDLAGGRRREIGVVIDLERLRGHGLAASDVVAAVRAQSIDVPGGRTTEAGRERVVTLQSEARTVDELASLVVSSVGGAPVRLRDVANVVDGPEEARSAARFNETPAIALIVRKQSGANTVAVAEAVKAELASINAQLPKGVRLERVQDGAKFIRSSIGAVQEDLMIGAVLAVLIVLLFLRNVRSMFVAATALPTSIIGTFAAMQALDFTFNVVTMLALTLSIGLLVDDAIVVIENIVRNLEEGRPPREAAYRGTTQIALAVLAVTLSVVAVFVPVAFMDGMMGQFFYSFGITVAVAVMISYVVSMTLTPMLSARLLQGHHDEGPVGRGIERALGAIERGYARLLETALRRRWATIGVATGVLVVTVGLASQLQFTFIPAQDQGNIKVTLELPAGTTLAETERELAALSAQLRKTPGVRDTFETAGGGVQEEVNKGEITVNLVPIGERAYSQAELKRHLRKALVRRADAKLGVLDFQPVSGGGNRPQQVQFNVRSEDWPALVAAAEKTRAYMHGNPGLVDIDSSYAAGKPQLKVIPDRDRAAAVGIPAASIGMTLRTLLSADKVASFRDENDSYDIKVRLPVEVLDDPQAVGSLTLRAPTGQLVEVRNVARVESGLGIASIDRQAQQRQITLLADVDDYSLGAAMGFLNEFAAKELPKHVQYDFEGQGRELAKAAIAFLSALLLGVVLLYMILAAQFESLVHPFTIMLALPLAVIGAIGALLVTGQFMSMFAMIGMIMLMGLVAKNGILLVDFTNQLKAAGKSTHDALVQAGRQRLRPILMTTVAMIAGMVPVALARGDGAEVRVPMAVAIIGGLITSTLLTLAVVPVVYATIDGVRARRRRAPEGVPTEAPELAAR